MAFDAAVGEVLRLALTAPGSGSGEPSTVSRLGDLVRDTPDAILAEVPHAARLHGVAGYTYQALRDTQIAPEVLGELRRLRDRAVFNHLRATADIILLDEVLGSAGIPWMIVKGATLAEPVHGSAQLRSYGDIDAIVPGQRLADTVAALEAAGGSVTDRNWTLIGAQMKGEVHVQLPSGTSLDLHWHLFNEPERRASFPVDLGGLFERRRHVQVNGRAVPTPSLPDTIVYVALHTMHSGGNRLIWLKDLEMLLAQPGSDVDAITARARSWHAELVLTSAIRRVELALGTPPLADALRACAPPPRMWSALSSAAWRRSPAEREDGRASIGRMVARSIRPTQRASVEELVRRAAAHLRHRADADDATATGRFGADDPRSDRFPAGGDAERDAFFARVAQEAGRPREGGPVAQPASPT